MSFRLVSFWLEGCQAGMRTSRHYCRITGKPEHSRLSLPAPDGEAAKVPYGRRYGNNVPVAAETVFTVSILRFKILQRDGRIHTAFHSLFLFSTIPALCLVLCLCCRVCSFWRSVNADSPLGIAIRLHLFVHRRQALSAWLGRTLCIRKTTSAVHAVAVDGRDSHRAHGHLRRQNAGRHHRNVPT